MNDRSIPDGPEPDAGCAPNASGGCPRSACLQLFVDGELDPTRASDLEAHLAACGRCTERASLLAATKVSLRRTCLGRAPDALRARVCLSLTRESAPREVAGRDPVDGVAAEFGALPLPSRESLAHDRAELLERRRGSSRTAIGVGVLALAAGMALAVVGERAGDEATAQLGGGDDPETTALDPASGARGEGSRGDDARPLDAAAIAMPAGAAPMAAGQLVPVSPRPTMIGVDAPSLSPSAIAGRAPEPRTTIDSVLDDLVAEHMNPLPVEETNVARLGRFERSVGVAMRPPRFRNARFRGARVLPIRGAQRTAMLTYDLPDGERVTVYLWNPQAVPIGATRLQPRIMREAREVRGADGDAGDRAPIYVGQARGYSVAACERRGVGYALATKRDADESVRMVATSLP